MKITKAAKAAVRNPRLAAFIAGVRIPLTKWERLEWVEGTRSKELRLLVLGTLLQLPRGFPEVLVARFGEGLTLAQYGARIKRSRERVRQMEAKALRQLRGRLTGVNLRDALTVVPVPGGPFDPAWITTKQAAELTELTMSHIRWLCRTQRIVGQTCPHNRGLLAIRWETLKAYVLGHATRGRRRGVWKGD